MSDLVRNPEDRFSHNEAQVENSFMCVNEGVSVMRSGVAFSNFEETRIVYNKPYLNLVLVKTGHPL